MPGLNAKPDFRISSVKDFKIRKRSSGFLELFMLCLAIGIIGMGMSLGLYDKLALLSIFYTVGGFISLYIAIQVRRNHHLVQSTEFLNALFASAIGDRYKFGLIVNTDGKIVYFNRAFQELFSDFVQKGDRAIKTWFKMGKVTELEITKIMESVAQEHADKVVVQIQDVLYTLTIEPISRPAGFALIRGRALVEENA